MCLDQPELFKVQLRALLRAAMHGDVRIMLPLIVTRRRGARGAAPARRGARGARRRGRRVSHATCRSASWSRPRRRPSRADTLAQRRRISSASARTISCSTRWRSTAATRTSRRASRRCIPAVLRLIKRTVDVGRAAAASKSPCAARWPPSRSWRSPCIGLGVRQLSVASALGAARQAHRARHQRAAGRRSGRPRRWLPTPRPARSASLRIGCARRSATRRFCDDGLPGTLAEPLSYRSAVLTRQVPDSVVSRHLSPLRTPERLPCTIVICSPPNPSPKGIPDKVADAISDAVLDAILAEDPAARVACETLVTTGLAVRRRRDHDDDVRRPSRSRARHHRADRLHRRELRLRQQDLRGDEHDRPAVARHRAWAWTPAAPATRA